MTIYFGKPTGKMIFKKNRHHEVKGGARGGGVKRGGGKGEEGGEEGVGR